MKAYFFEAFEGMKRLGPGSAESTRRAMEFFPRRQEAVKILDIGCGAGTQTLLLAEGFPKAEIMAIDTHEPYLDILRQTSVKLGFVDRLQVQQLSMFEMDFPDESFDLIWAEGSIYIAGFAQGLEDWKRFLKPGGFLICSELSWLKGSPSEESFRFWTEAYSGIGTIEIKTSQIEAAGYRSRGSFICPVTDWTVNYYAFLSENLDKMREKYRGEEEAKQAIAMLQSEIDLYEAHSNDYSYVFYAMERL